MAISEQKLDSVLPMITAFAFQDNKEQVEELKQIAVEIFGKSDKEVKAAIKKGEGEKEREWQQPKADAGKFLRQNINESIIIQDFIEQAI